MQLEHEVSIEMDEGVEYFPHFAVESTSSGTRIEVLSPIFAEVLGKLPRNEVKGKGAWTGHTFLIPSPEHLEDLYINAGGGLFSSDGETPNMVWMLHPDLGVGVTFEVPEPLSVNNLEDYFTSVCEELRDFYLSKIRKVKLKAKLRDRGKKATALRQTIREVARPRQAFAWTNMANEGAPPPPEPLR